MARVNESGETQPEEAPPKTSTQDPACDQCRQRKVRCDRRTPRCTNCAKARVPCGFSNRTKRVNHTKKLLSDFETLGKRLDRIEGAVSTMARINQSENGSLPSSADNSAPITPTFAERHSFEEPSSMNTDQTMLFPLATDADKSFQVVKDGLEQFRGSSSLHNVIHDAIAATSGLLQDSSSFSGSSGSNNLNKRALCDLDPNFEVKMKLVEGFLDICDNDAKSDFHGDGMPLCYPPYALLCTFVEPYLASVNKLWPIFNRDTLINAIGEAYSNPDHVPDPAWMVIFNSIVLSVLTLNMNFLGTNNKNTLDDTLLASFLSSTRRCFDNFDKLLKPRLVNVQALTALSLVALTCFHFSTFEMVFASACQVARGIGLNQRFKGQSGQDQDDQDSQRMERYNLFWTLYTLDKRLPFLSGTACHLHIFDCDVPYISFEPDEETNACRIASSQLAEIQEVIYKNLYSAEVGRLSQDQRRQRLKTTMDALETWSNNHTTLVDAEPNSLHRLELIYSLALCRILVLRCYQDEQSRQARVHHCRTALNALKAMLSFSADLHRNVFLERVLSCCPLNAFFELYNNLILSPPAEPVEDVYLLAACADAIESVPGRRFQISHSFKLKTITTLLSSIAASVATLRDSELTSNNAMYALRTALPPASEPTWLCDPQLSSSERSSLSSGSHSDMSPSSSMMHQAMSSSATRVPQSYMSTPPSGQAFPTIDDDAKLAAFTSPPTTFNPAAIQPYDPSLNFIQGNDSQTFFDDLFFDMNLNKQGQM